MRGGGSKFLPLYFNTSFQFVFHKKYDGTLSAYQTNDVVRMMIVITILMLNMST
jgi:hypothetical protein